MTKLNYDRPIFRYLDNLRREINKGPAWNLPDDYVFEGTIITAEQQATNRRVHLNKSESAAALKLLETLDVYLGSYANCIEKSSKNRRARLESADNELIASAKAFVARAVIEGVGCRDNLMNWYAQLEKKLRESDEGDVSFAWDILNSNMHAAIGQLSKMVDQMVE